MKRIVPAFAMGLLVGLGVAANAQDIQHPATVKIAGLTADYYAQEPPAEAEPSPSDVPQAQPAVGPSCAVSCDAQAACGCCSCYLWGPAEPWELCPVDPCTGIKIGGWVSAGYHNKATPLSRVRGDGLSFNDVPHRLNAHQVWMYLERDAQGDCCSWDYGYRVDVLYGTDAQKTQAYGNDVDAFGNPRRWDNPLDHGTYGWAIPQAYVELARGDLSIIGGHFFTPVGYEVVQATGNFFYSHALTHVNSEPFTHTGVLARYNLGGDVEVFGGWALGWDTGFDQFANGNIWLAGISMPVTDGVTFVYGATGGDFGLRGDQAYSHHMYLDFQLNDCWEYILYSDYVTINAGNPNGVPAGQLNDQISVVQYLFYTYNDCIKFGGRLEWWKSDGNSHYELTGGVNIRPHANLVIRPEIRYDWQPFANFDQTTFGMDAVLTW